MYMTSRQEACCSCPTWASARRMTPHIRIQCVRSAPGVSLQLRRVRLCGNRLRPRPHPWMLSVNSLLSGEAERSLDLLRRAVMDNGIVCESIDEHTGRSATETPLPLAGFVCHALRYALGGVSYEN